MNNISVQLYSVRDLSAKDFEGTVRKVAALGYQGVETDGLTLTTPSASAQLFEELGLKVVASHAALPHGEKQNELIEAVLTVGSPVYIVPSVKAEDITSVAATQRTCERLNQAAQVCRQQGLAFGFHNHTAEMADLGGQRVYQVMNAALDPQVLFELDTYWVKTAGLDPAAVVTELGPRARLLHLKDGPATRRDPMVALGDGVMDFPALIKAARYLEVPIVEFDSCAGDILAELKKSADYLKAL